MISASENINRAVGKYRIPIFLAIDSLLRQYEQNPSRVWPDNTGNIALHLQ
jgi:hypothetical protein